MRYVKIVALAFASMLTVIMAQAGNAAAVLLFLVCLPGNGLTRYTSSTCLTAGGTGSTRWESRGLLAGEDATVVILRFTALFRDTGAKSGINCFMHGSRGEGRIKPNGESEVTVDEYENAKENCRGIEGCEANGVEEVKGVNLPWKKELTEGPEGKVLGVIRGIGGVKPGYRVKCKVLGISVTDVCEEESSAEKHEEINERTRGLGGGEESLIKYRLEDVMKGKCSIGGAGASKQTGAGAELLPGGALSITQL